MGLKVWLPLNGTLENRGLDGIGVTSTSGTVSYTKDGKTGRALSCNGSTYCVFNGLNLGSEATICCWSKTSTQKRMKWVIECEVSDRLNLCENGFYTLNTGDSNENPFKDESNNTIPVLVDGVWHHFAVTFGNNQAKLYIDGQYRGTATTFKSPACTNGKLKLAGGYNNVHTYDWTGQLDDFRIYDYCLSVKEIKEIYQALILHYGLDIEPKNLVPFQLTTENYTQNNYQTRTTSTISDFVYHVDGLQSETSLDTSYSILSTNYVTLPSNTTVYLSFHCKGKNTVDFYFGTTGYSAITRLIDSSNNGFFSPQQVTIGSVCDCWVTLPITTGSDTQYKIQIGMDNPNIFGIGSYIEYKDIMVSTEEPRNYVPYTENNIVYDCSGYIRNGNINGSVSLDSDSPRYGTCAVFDGNDYIVVPKSVKVKDSITICMWAYMSDWSSYASRLISCTEGGGWNFEPASGKLNFVMGTGSSSNTYKSATSTTTLAQLGSGWHHFAGTYDGFKTKLYIDGVLDATNDAYTTKTPIFYNSANGVFIGAEAQTSETVPATSPVKFSGKMSDVRIYATALSAEDIMDLYSTSAYVHNTGTLSCFAINESSENLLKYENTVLYTNPANTDTRGKYSTRNGDVAMLFRPTDTYYGSGDERNGKLLYGFFKENTSYVFDLWIDVDDIVYQNINRMGGFTVVYTDGTTETTFQLTGSTDPYTGWQHRVLVTNPNKTVKSIEVYYYTNSLLYVRSDSFIVECSQTDINENGVVDSGNFIEDTDVANIGKATFNSNHIIEI